MDALMRTFVDAFGGSFMHSEPGPGVFYIVSDDLAYLIPDESLEQLLAKSLESSCNLIVQRFSPHEYLPGLVY